MLGKQQAVYQQPQLTVGEITHKVKIGQDTTLLQLACAGIWYHADSFAVLDVVTEVDKVHQVALYCFSVNVHLIFGAEDVHDVLLAEAVFLVGVFAEDVEDVDYKELFGWCCV